MEIWFPFTSLVIPALSQPLTMALSEMVPKETRQIMDKCKQIVIAHYNEPSQDGMFNNCTKDLFQKGTAILMKRTLTSIILD